MNELTDPVEFGDLLGNERHGTPDSLSCAYTNAATIQIIQRTLGNHRIDDRTVAAILMWIDNEKNILEIGFSERLSDALGIGRSVGRGRKMRVRAMKQRFQEHRDELLRTLGSTAKMWESRYTTDPVLQNISWLSELIRLDQAEQAILVILMNYLRDGPMESFCDCLRNTTQCVSIILSYMLGISRRQVESRLNSNSALVASGLIRVNSNGHHLTGVHGYLRLSKQFELSLQEEFASLSDLCDALFGDPVVASLEWDDFLHVARDRDFALRLLDGASKSEETGINILLHGPPGCGKTEFCKTLASKAGVFLYAIGESDERGSEMSRSERVSAISCAQRLMSKRRGVAILFDEMEDLLSVGHQSRPHENVGSKVFINRLLERNAVPTLWTCNDIRSFDPSMLRRMTFVIEMKTPGINERERVWGRLLEAAGIDAAKGDVRSLAEDLEIPPAIAAGAVKAALVSNGDLGDIRYAAEGVAKIVQGTRPVSSSTSSAPRFDLGLANCDLDLDVLLRAVKGPKAVRDFSLCLYGPPGTGKSAFARLIAKEMGLRVMQRRASDLLDMYVGNTEKAIARAFEQAGEDGAFLIFDEADSLLAERGRAHRSWEVTQVNEMLTWMESHPFPFCCTTNDIVALDQASLRRFTVKVKFDYLTADQVGLAFKSFFDLSPPSSLRQLTNVTPGDLIVVREKARMLDRLSQPGVLADMLIAESEIKSGQSRQIGFIN